MLTDQAMVFVVSFSSLPVFLPTILKNMGFTAINAQGLSAPPYFLSFFACIGTTYIADRTRQRGYMIMLLSIVGGVGYILLAVSETVGVRYFGVFLAAGGVFPAISNILPWTLNNQGSDSKRGAGITLLNLIGQCGPILGTRMFPTRDAPYYVKGMAVCASFSELNMYSVYPLAGFLAPFRLQRLTIGSKVFFNALLALTLRTYLAWENKKFKAREDASRMADINLEEPKVGIENEGYGFRNIL